MPRLGTNGTVHSTSAALVKYPLCHGREEREENEEKLVDKMPRN
jgi:hypothetical protein